MVYNNPVEPTEKLASARPEKCDDPLVAAAIEAARNNPDAWWETKYGTVLIHRPDVVLWVSNGESGLVFGAGMPPVFGKRDIAPIPTSRGDKHRLYKTLEWVRKEQLAHRRAKALASVGRDPLGRPSSPTDILPDGEG